MTISMEPNTQLVDIVDQLSEETGPRTPVIDGASLDGRLEKARFAPGLTIALGLIVGFLAFQGISLIVALGIIVAKGGLDPSTIGEIPDFIGRYAREFLIANTVGQFVGLLGLAWLLARLHTGDARAFLRIRGADLRFTILSILGLVALVPVVQWLGTFSDALPWPDAIREFESVQMELLDQVLKQNLGMVFTVATMALTPAICEEVFFRGYIQRQAERAFTGPLAAVVFSGVIFGLYHLRLTQAIPLSVLGIFLAYVTWRSRSLVPAILVHFLNNGMAVVASAVFGQEGADGSTDLNTLQIPVYILVPSLVVFVVILVALQRRGASATSLRGTS